MKRFQRAQRLVHRLIRSPQDASPPRWSYDLHTLRRRDLVSHKFVYFISPLD